MSQNIIKLAVGIDDLRHLYEVQQAYAFDYDGRRANKVRTRYKPRQAEEILQGGSLYRVIKNKIQCRQQILGFESEETSDKGTQCVIVVANEIIQTVVTPKKPFQGWRYLKLTDVPADRGVYDGNLFEENAVPDDMEEDLKEMGLI